MDRLAYMFCIVFLAFTAIWPNTAQSFGKLDTPPLSERWFGLYVDKDQVGFCRQKIEETSDGYQMEVQGNARIKVMGFSNI